MVFCMEITYYVIRDRDTSHVVYVGQTADPHSRKAAYISSPLSSGCGGTVPLVSRWAEQQIANGSPPIFEPIGKLDLSLLPPTAVRSCKKQVERCLIHSFAELAMQRGDLLLNLHGNKYRQHNTGKSLVVPEAIDALKGLTDEEVAATVAASRVMAAQEATIS
jgi:hypothetical protein